MRPGLQKLPWGHRSTCPLPNLPLEAGSFPGHFPGKTAVCSVSIAAAGSSDLPGYGRRRNTWRARRLLQGPCPRRCRRCKAPHLDGIRWVAWRAHVAHLSPEAEAGAAFCRVTPPWAPIRCQRRRRLAQDGACTDAHRLRRAYRPATLRRVGPAAPRAPERCRRRYRGRRGRPCSGYVVLVSRRGPGGCLRIASP